MTGERKVMLAGAALALVALVAGGVILGSRADGDRFAACRRSAVSGGLDALGGPFTLTSETGARVTSEQVFDKPSLLYFGYTFCPDVCPLDNARNAEAVDLLEEKGRIVTPVFIGVDPKRDTPEMLTSFTDALHPRMIGLTGSPEEIAAVNKLWRNYYKINDADGGDDYLVDHMTNTYLVMPGAGTVEFFGRDVPAAEMAERVGCFIDAAK